MPHDQSIAYQTILGSLTPARFIHFKTISMTNALHAVFDARSFFHVTGNFDILQFRSMNDELSVNPRQFLLEICF